MRETYRLACLRRLDLAVDTDDVHGNSLRGARPQKTPPAAERVGDEDEEEEAADDLDDAVDSCGKQLH